MGKAEATVGVPQLCVVLLPPYVIDIVVMRYR